MIAFCSLLPIWIPACSPLQLPLLALAPLLPTLHSLKPLKRRPFGGATSNAKLLNPDISLIGDFIGTAGRNTVSPSPSLQLHESEIGLQAIIDPYARADFFISFGETGVNLEEGYITFTSLPAGLLLKVGKMRAAFGKVNTIHNHALPWMDRPLVTDNLVGGEDGIDDAGFSLSRIPARAQELSSKPPPRSSAATPRDVFTANRAPGRSVVGHLRATATSPNPPTSISASPTRAAITTPALSTDLQSGRTS